MWSLGGLSNLQISLWFWNQNVELIINVYKLNLLYSPGKVEDKDAKEITEKLLTDNFLNRWSLFKVQCKLQCNLKYLL